MRLIIETIQQHIPEPVRVLGAAFTFFGVSLSDCKDIIQIAVGVATVAYIMTKTIKIWTKKNKKEQP